jgi:hypothetical protein
VAVPREAHHLTKGKRVIVDRDHHDRQRTLRRERRLQSDLWAGGQNDIDVTRAQLVVPAFESLRARSRHDFEDLAGLHQIAGKPPT